MPYPVLSRTSTQSTISTILFFLFCNLDFSFPFSEIADGKFDWLLYSGYEDFKWTIQA